MPEQSASTRRSVVLGLAGSGVLAAIGAGAAQADDVASEGTVAQYPSSSDRNVVRGQSSAVLPLAIQSNPGQTTNLQEWRDETGAVTAAIAPSGRFVRPNTGAGKAPFVWEVGGGTFNGRFDPTMFFGYNVSDRGNRIVAGEPYAAYIIESDYDDGTKRTMEQYHELRSADGSVSLRPVFFQVKRDATTPESFLTGSEVIGNPLIVKIPRSGAGTIESQAAEVARFDGNLTTLSAPDATDNTLLIKAPPGRNSRVSLGADGVSDVWCLTTSKGPRLDVVGSTGNRILSLFSRPKGANGAAMSVGVIDTGAVATFDGRASANSVKGLVVRAKATTTANLVELQDADAKVLSGYTRTGHWFTAKTAPPPDADIQPSQVAFWFDDRPGATRLVIRGRDAAGALKVATVDMASPST
jgi:hypothetical protein